MVLLHLKKAIKLAGGQKLLGQKIGASQQSVSLWVRAATKGLPPPVKWTIAIEKATDGAVRCEDLRPDIDWGYLRRNHSDIGIS